MAFEPSAVGVLILATMALYLAAFVTLVVRARKVGLGLFVAGFAVAASAFVARWVQVGHVPMQNLFEVFLTMAMLVLPVSLFCRHVLKVRAGPWDAMIACLVVVPMVLGVFFPEKFPKFTSEPHPLMPALQSPLFGPHVASYLLAYIILAKALVQALGRLFVGERPSEEGVVSYEAAIYRTAAFGFPFLTLGLVLGAWWGKLAWGDYWNWDPKEQWSLVSWLVFLGYFHLRSAWGRRYPRLACALIVLGVVCILITLFWANLSKLFPGLHSYA